MSKVIKELYDLEQSETIHEIQSSKITVKVPVTTAALFNAVAARFETSRFNLVEPILIDAAQEMFNSLSDEDKKTVSEAADSEVTELLYKSGKIKSKTVGLAGNFENECSHWREALALRKHFESKRKDS
ncbi:MAG: hypothetical protein GY738_16020 [Pseudoalteromonas sp.]|jgi:hypothetical protein|nr:hypothetical protein [Pseudoalteromonas sp.]